MVGYLTELFQKCSGYVALYDAGVNCFRWNWSDRRKAVSTYFQLLSLHSTESDENYDRFHDT